jgi:hypothetical protein
MRISWKWHTGIGFSLILASMGVEAIAASTSNTVAATICAPGTGPKRLTPYRDIARYCPLAGLR